MLESRVDQLKEEVNRVTEKHKEITIEKDNKQRILTQKTSALELLRGGKAEGKGYDSEQQPQEKNEIPDADQSTKEQLQQEIYNQLHEFIDTKAETVKIDIEKAVGPDERLNHLEKGHPAVVSAVRVKLLAMDFLNQPESTDYTMFVHTFKVTEKTMFHHLHQAACDFWGLLEDNYQLYMEKNGKIESISKENPQVISLFEKRIQEHNKHENISDD